MFKVHYKDQSGISDIFMVSFDVFLMFLLLTLNIFYTFSVSIDDIEQEMFAGILAVVITQEVFIYYDV